MKHLILSLLFLLPATAMAAGGSSVPLDSADVDLGDEASLQRGAKYFVNYCLNCHSAKYMRYQSMTELGLTKEQIEDNLMFTTDKVGDLMTVAMDPLLAEQWFGAAPPDLTLSARLRGEDWLYTYLRSFYADDSRPLGVNNLVFPSVGMPHVLQDLQGIQEAVWEETVGADGKPHKEIKELKLVAGSGKLSVEEYDQVARDIVTYMSWLAEPMQQERKRLGIWVLLFLAFFTVIAYFLKKEYWKDVH
jgi:ubiquinol-cytochrome c reductase cytochrome c1 subunit